MSRPMHSSSSAPRRLDVIRGAGCSPTQARAPATDPGAPAPISKRGRHALA